MKRILGISAFYHDSAASLIVNNKIIAAAQEERFTRIKHTPDFPTNAIKYCLAEGNLTLDEIDAVVFYDKPLLKFERLLETYYAFAPKGLASFLKAMPIWVKEKLFLKKHIFDGLKEVGEYKKKKLKLLFTEHHLSHAASAFFPSQFENAAILTIDGVGEWCTASIGYGDGNKITIQKEMNFPHSVGLLYSAFTYYLGFTVNSGEYKVMGLAPYGNPNSDQVQKFITIIKENLVDIKEDGSVWLNQRYFNYSVGLRMVYDNKWEKLFGFPRRKPESDLEQHYCDLALAIQKITEEIVFKMAIEAKRTTGSNNLCMAGGVALNCVANGKLLKEGIFDTIYIQPAAGDAGGALGAALAINYMYYCEKRPVDNQQDQMFGAYLGPDYTDKEIELMCRKTNAVYNKYDSINELSKEIALKISKGNVVGWFQGRMEFGPRALGNRSILADAKNADMQKKLNLKIKYRESFRPFAASVLEEDVQEYFNLSDESPYMLIVAPIAEKRKNPLPGNFYNLPLLDRLYSNRSNIQSVAHLDFSARIQTVKRQTNPAFWELMSELKKLTGDSLVINTSFNVRGEPIVCSPYDAYRCFMSTEMDYLVINKYCFNKINQPDYQNKDLWKINFKLD